MSNRTGLPPIEQYRKFGCPKCGAKHRYGHHAEYLSCWRCYFMFNPAVEGRRYESERIKQNDN